MTIDKVLCVVATYNEAVNLPALIERIAGLSLPISVLVVDDDSPDGTATVARCLSHRFDWLRIMERRMRTGLGAALKDAFRRAMELPYNHFVNMDADLSHDPADLRKLIDASCNADVVIGSRYCGGVRVMNWPVRRL